MSEREDVEALVDWVVRWLYNGPDGHRGPPPPRESLVDLECDARNAIEAVLASSWLAAHDEAVRVSERVRLAGRLERWAGHYRDDRRGVYYEHAARIVGEPERLIEPSVPGVRLTEEE